MRVRGEVIDVAAMDRHMAGASTQLRVLAQVSGQIAFVVPDEVAGGGVERLQVIAVGMGDVHDAVVDQRPDLLRAFVHGSHPCQL